MKPYFAKYLPVEGEIKKGMKYILTKSHGLGAYQKGYIGKAAIDFTPEAQEYQGGKILKLFLCSRDIQVGDKVNFKYTVKEVTENKGENPDEVKLLKQGVTHWFSFEKGGLGTNNDTFKVIGEILTPGIKEGQEFTEEEKDFLTIGEINT